MTSLKLRSAFALGVALFAWSAPAPAQTDKFVTLDEALALSGAAGGGAPGELNPRVVGPQEDVAAARALVEQAGLRPNPEISVEVENVAGTGLYSGVRATEVTLAASLPLELGDKRRARIDVARAELDLAQLRGELALADLSQAVRERYVIAVAAHARVRLAEEVYERARELARVADVLVDVGREPPLRALRAQSERAEAEAELKAAQAQAIAARFGLGALWGSDVAPLVPATFPVLEPPSAVLAGYEALEPRIASVERAALQAATAQERSLAVPDPTISAGVRRYEESNDQALLVGVSVALPLRNRNQGNIAAAQARARGAVAREVVAVTEYQRAIAQTRADYLAAEAKATTLENQSLPQAEEALRLSEVGYRNGRFPLIEVLAAADARDGIRRSLIDAREAQGLAAARLIRLATQ